VATDTERTRVTRGSRTEPAQSRCLRAKQRSLHTNTRGQASHHDGLSARRSSGWKPEYLWYRTMTYSKGAPGEVMLDGTVSDPVACPSDSPLSVRRIPFRSSIREARGAGPSRPHVQRCACCVGVSMAPRPCVWALRHGPANCHHLHPIRTQQLGAILFDCHRYSHHSGTGDVQFGKLINEGPEDNDPWG